MLFPSANQQPDVGRVWNIFETEKSGTVLQVLWGVFAFLPYLLDLFNSVLVVRSIVDSMRITLILMVFIRSTRYSEKLVRHTYSTSTHFMHDLSNNDPPAIFYYWLRDVLSLGYSMGL